MMKKVSIMTTFAIITLISGGCGTLSSLAEKAGIIPAKQGIEEKIDWGTPSTGHSELAKDEKGSDGEKAGSSRTPLSDRAGDSRRTIGADSPRIEAAEPEKLEHPGEISFPEHIFLTKTQKNLLATAKSKLGCKYSYAGSGPNSFDCSGFMLYVFAKEGIDLPHGSAAQYSKGRAIAKGEPLRTGDLVFWSGRKISATVGHVGMVVDYDSKTGEFTFIHAAMTGVEIQKSTAGYYALRYIGARRILADDQ